MSGEDKPPVVVGVGVYYVDVRGADVAAVRRLEEFVARVIRDAPPRDKP